MHILVFEKRKVGQIAGLFGALIAITFTQSTPSYAGVINSDNATNAVGLLAGAAAGAAAGGAIVGSFAGPPGAVAVGAGAATGVITSAVTYTVVTKSIQHPMAALQTVVALNPIIGPLYIAKNPTSVASGAKQFWNYLFG